MRVALIPSGQPWQKPHVLPATQRLTMLQLAMQDDQALWAAKHTSSYPLLIDALELNKSEVSYTINTLRDLRLAHPNTPLVWVMGSDQLNNLHTWHDWESLLDYAHIAVAQRDGHATLADNDAPAVQKMRAQESHEQPHWQSQLSGQLIPFTLPPSPISSSFIRHAIASGQDPRSIPELSPSVAKHIHQHQLYNNKELT